MRAGLRQDYLWPTEKLWKVAVSSSSKSAPVVPKKRKKYGWDGIKHESLISLNALSNDLNLLNFFKEGVVVVGGSMMLIEVTETNLEYYIGNLVSAS
jgi:hypothetical protein